MELREVFESNLKLNEEIRGKPGVLGVVEGVFFLPEVPSRNSRIYPRALWERVLSSPDVRRLLENRLMIGTVGHEDVDFDALIREQKVSHVVTDLYIGEDGKGYGRAEILDTPVGRILYTLLKSGSKLAVSSKGWGQYKATKDGMYVVDEGTYMLERFDFVVDPGFLDAVPSLKKQYESLISSKQKEVNKMEAVELLIKEKVALQEKLQELLEKVEKLEQELQHYKSENEELKEKVNKSTQKPIDEAFYKEMKECLGVEQDEIVGEVKLLSKLIEEEAEKLVKKGVKEEDLVGSSLSEVLVRVFNKLHELPESIERKEVSESALLLKIHEKALRRKNEKIRRLERILAEAKRKLAIVESLGGIDAIVNSLTLTEKLITKELDKVLNEQVKKIALRTGKKEDEVRKLVESLGVKKTEEILAKDVKQGKDERRVVNVGESKDVFSKDLVERLVEKFM